MGRHESSATNRRRKRHERVTLPLSLSPLVLRRKLGWGFGATSALIGAHAAIRLQLLNIPVHSCCLAAPRLAEARFSHSLIAAISLRVSSTAMHFLISAASALGRYQLSDALPE